MLSSVVAAFPGCPRLLQWMCTGWGRPSAFAAPASTSRIFRGVTALEPSVSSRPLTLRRSPPPDTLPHRYPAGVDDLDPVRPRGAQQPRGVIAGPAPLTGGDLAGQVLVVA